MKLFDIFKRKDKSSKLTNKKSNDVSIMSETDILLDHEIDSFFPLNGSWAIECYGKPEELVDSSMPCHLRDDKWLAELLALKMKNKGVSVTANEVEEFIKNSQKFKDLRHAYELEIVKWQIEFMNNGGENWLFPRGMSRDHLATSSDVVEIFRSGIARSLKTIGMDQEVVEEGIEKNANLFREKYIKKGYENEFEPMLIKYTAPEFLDKEHKLKWIAAKRYDYYVKHKDSVDKYGKPHPDMLMSDEYAAKLKAELEIENKIRENFVRQWVDGEITGLSGTVNEPLSNNVEQERE